MKLSNDLAELLGSVELRINKDKNFKNLPNVENVLRIKVNCDSILDNYSPRNIDMLVAFTTSSKIGRIESPKINFPVWKKCRNINVKEQSLVKRPARPDLQFSTE